MFDNYYEDNPVGWTGIETQKEAMGYKDETYIEFGKGVTGKSNLEAMGYKPYESKVYAANKAVIKDGKLYMSNKETKATWDASEWTEVKS